MGFTEAPMSVGASCPRSRERSERVHGELCSPEVQILEAAYLFSLLRVSSLTTFTAGISRSQKRGENTSTLLSVRSSETATHFARRGTLTLLNRIVKKLM
ncbi:hypothetical protein C481_17102 [Natrialba asiatica DSM 12278]|uniref:Uncharacterized protein n=1 Tax=Natrialba asiatica (strain ATCC 700177 / DSM 12278 / JCM 9576 / FERM P-10747 / NBRC 102637 / 172P1) TaxID=29540 RepID=M0AMQ5_NATA1|nr:hypothetical protein C481_17102 [Natrialba asiatica DSM 12278]